MQNDDNDLRGRFHTLADAADKRTPDLTAAHINAWQSTVHLRRRQAVGVGMVIGMAAGAVITLTIGLVLGASTGYASAETIIRARGDTPLPPQPTLAVLKNIPNITSLGCPAPARAVELPPAQQGVPITDLPAPTAKSAELFRGILGMHQVANGSLIVNDAMLRLVRVLDTSLAVQSVARDSAPGSANSYGMRPSPMIRYVGDSSLMVDQGAGVILVLGPTGQVARTMAPTSQDMLVGLGTAVGGSDDRGRIAHELRLRPTPGALNADSAMVVRSDPETRRVDTLARVKSLSPTRMMGKAEGSSVVRYTVEPAPLLDAWAQLSDGSIAIVRGQDFHIDWIHADGTTHSTGKLPFDWKRLTDEDKQRLIDSTRAASSPALAKALGASPQKAAAIADGGGGDPSQKPSGGGRGYAPADPNAPPAAVEYVPPALKDMPDYYPPIRRGSVLPDLDGNLWILPTSSAQSKAGELVYDVVNVKGEFHRVRVPLGRSIAGFGKGGIVYLLNGDRTNGFYLEKTRLPKK